MRIWKYWKVWILVIFLILAIVAINPTKPNIHFGLDIQGGLWAIVEPEGNVSFGTLEDVKSILQQRTSSLRESSFQIIQYQNKSFIQIQIAGGTEDDLRKIINTTGIFEGKIPIRVELKNGAGVLKIGDKNEWLNIEKVDDHVNVDGKQYGINDSFVYKDIPIKITNITNDEIVFETTVYRNAGNQKDIVRVYDDPQHSYIRNLGDYYNWQFSVEVSPDAAKRFYDVVRNLDVIYRNGRSYLSSKIYLYLDNKLVSNLSISSDLRLRPVTEASVTGSAKTFEEAVNEKRFLQLVLRSGALPAKLRIVSIKQISPKLGPDFLNNIGKVALIALVIVFLIIFFRYRSIKLSLLVVATMISEVIIILGASVFINWTIDLAAIAAILSVIGTGVDQQIMIIDEIRSGEKWSLRAKIKRAFFIIFGAAGTTLSAMLPLMTLGFGLLRGFALTTSLGVLIGIFITRPAFAQLVEMVIKE